MAIGEKLAIDKDSDAYKKRLERNEATRLAKLQYLQDYKMERGCQDPDCLWEGEFIPEMLDLDHINPETKNGYLRTTRSQGLYQLGWDNMIAEISKCQVLCANCHRKKTVAER